jgi:hypothetical protein
MKLSESLRAYEDLSCLRILGRFEIKTSRGFNLDFFFYFSFLGSLSKLKIKVWNHYELITCFLIF